VNPILIEYPFIAATGEVNHAEILHSVFWTEQLRGIRFALSEDASRSTAKVVFATELLDLTTSMEQSLS